MKNIKIGAIFALIMLIAAVGVQGATEQDTTVTFVIPSSLAVSLAYGNAESNTCSSSDFYFVEDDATIDGSQTDINVSDNVAGGSSNYCQNGSIDGITISNDGNDNIDIFAGFTSALPTGVTTYVGDTDAATADPCSDTADLSTSCINITDSFVRIFTNIASAASEETWWRSTFASADLGSGVGNEGSASRTLRINISATS